MSRLGWGLYFVLVLAQPGWCEPWLREVLILRDQTRLSGESLEVSHDGILWRRDNGETHWVEWDQVLGLVIERGGDSTSSSTNSHLDQAPTMAPELEFRRGMVDSPTDPATDNPADAATASLYSWWLQQSRQLWDQTWSVTQAWTRRIQIGGQFIEGNARVTLIDVMAEFERGTPTHMRQIDAGGQWGRNRSNITANRWFLNSNFDWPVHEGSKWLYFVTTKNEYNELQHLDYRGTIAAGGGYRFFLEAQRRLIVRMGPALTLEYFNSPEQNRMSPDLYTEVELCWPLSARIQIEERMRIQPSVLNFGLVRIQSNSSLIWDLDNKEKWKLRLGFQYQYNSEPNPGRAPSDYLTTLSLVYLRK